VQAANPEPRPGIQSGRGVPMNRRGAGLEIDNLIVLARAAERRRLT